MKRLRVGTACGEDWSAMPRVPGGRACGACAKRVVDLSGMTEREAHAIFAAAGGELCGRTLADERGDALWRPERAARTSVALVAASMALAACGGVDRPPTVAAAPHATAPARDASPPPAPVDSDGDGIPDEVDRCPTDPGVADADSVQNGCPRHFVGIIVTGPVQIPNKIHFATSSSKPLTEAAPVLDAIAEALKQHAELCHLRVEGHAAPGDADVKHVGLRRAEAVVNELVRRGVAKERLQAVGFGDEHPLGPNDGLAHIAENRRVEIVVVEGDCNAVATR